MSIIALRAWYLQDYEPISAIEKRPPDLRLSKKSLLKSALRADFLEDSEQVKQSTWFERYLEGENIEFYIEGSGGYCVANVDLISHEIYFTKQAILAQSPSIFLSYQTEYDEANMALRESLRHTMETLNKRSRLPLSVVESMRPGDSAVRLNRTMMRKIRSSLLFIADTSAVAITAKKDNTLLIPSLNVCIEIGYAIESKRTDQIMLVQMQRTDMEGQTAFDLPNQQKLQYRDRTELDQMLPQFLENQLVRYRLFI